MDSIELTGRKLNVELDLIDSPEYSGCDGCSKGYSDYFVLQNQSIDFCRECADMFEEFVNSPEMQQKVIKKALKNVKAHNKRVGRDG